MIAAAESVRDRAIVLSGLGLGLRVAEIVALRVEDFDFAEMSVFVRQGKGKKDRFVALPQSLVAPMTAWIGERRVGWLFPSKRKPGEHLGRRAVQHLVERLKKKAGIVRRCSVHTLRHSYAMALLRTRAELPEIQRLLGHSSLNSTAHYLHCDSSTLNKVVDRLEFGREIVPPPNASPLPTESPCPPPPS